MTDPLVQVWTDGEGGATPLSAQRLTAMVDAINRGIAAADTPGTPAAKARYDTGNGGNGFTVPPTTATYVPWSLTVGGYADDLLDLTDPTQPITTAAGTYMVTVSLNADTNLINSRSRAMLILGDGVNSMTTAITVVPAAGLSPASLTQTSVLGVGESVKAYLSTDEPSDTIWYGSMMVVRM